MRRLTPFERDFADLHGRPPGHPQLHIEAEFVDVTPRRPQARAKAMPVDYPGFRLAMGLLGLFWIVVFAGALVGMGSALVAFLLALFGL